MPCIRPCFTYCYASGALIVSFGTILNHAYLRFLWPSDCVQLITEKVEVDDDLTSNEKVVKCRANDEKKQETPAKNDYSHQADKNDDDDVLIYVQVSTHSNNDDDDNRGRLKNEPEWPPEGDQVYWVLEKTLRDATLSIFVTSFTTSAAYLSTVSSTMPALKVRTE